MIPSTVERRGKWECRMRASKKRGVRRRALLSADIFVADTDTGADIRVNDVGCLVRLKTSDHLKSRGVSLEPPPMRPYCICHMISSIDGRLLVDRWTAHAHGDKDDLIQKHYEAAAETLAADAFLVGRTSMAEFDEIESATPNTGSVQARPAFFAEGNGEPWAVVIDTKGKLRYTTGQVEGCPVVAILSHVVTDNYLESLRAKGVSYVFAGDDGHDLKAALEILRASLGIERLLLEGGGLTNGAFLNAGLIDEFSVLIYPGVDGRAGGPSIIESAVEPGAPVSPDLKLTFLSTEALSDGFVWLRYRVGTSA